MSFLPQNDLDYVFEATRNLWEVFRGERLFVTGGTGFFGRWLIESFLRANRELDLNAEITILSRYPNRLLQTNPDLAINQSVHFLQGDVRTFNYPEGEYGFVIHAAAEANSASELTNPLTTFDTIVEGTRHTLDFASLHGVRHFLFISSGAVYGKVFADTMYIPEDYTGSPSTTEIASAYGEGKRAAEMLCNLYGHQSEHMEIKIARCFAFIGPNFPLNSHFAIGNFIRDAINGGPIILNGDGTPFRSYLYASDLAVWLWTILVNGKSNRVYNVGSKNVISILELAHMISSHFDPITEIAIRKVPGSNRQIESYVPSTERCNHELGLQETISLDEAIRKTIQYYQSI